MKKQLLTPLLLALGLLSLSIELAAQWDYDGYGRIVGATGSYQRHCSGSYVMGDTLYSWCGKDQTSITKEECPSGDISSCDGILHCGECPADYTAIVNPQRLY